MNPGVWIAIFLVAIVVINYLGVRWFGEIEFYLSSFKIIVIIALIFLSLILVCGGGPDGKATGFEYWKDPGAFHVYILSRQVTILPYIAMLTHLSWKCRSLPGRLVHIHNRSFCLLGNRARRRYCWRSSQPTKGHSQSHQDDLLPHPFLLRAPSIPSRHASPLQL